MNNLQEKPSKLVFALIYSSSAVIAIVATASILRVLSWLIYG